MTSSDYRKMLSQLKNHKVKAKKFLKHNKPKDRKHGRMTKKCRICGNTRGMISKYNIMLCRRCFRLAAKELGFKKYR